MRQSGFVCVCASLLAVSIAAAAELPDGFRLEPFVSGLMEPSDLDDTPDGLILIAERTTGDVRYVRWGELQATALCHVNVNTTGERGLLGIAVHPDYAANGWIYLYYTDQASGNNKVTRFTVSQFACHSPLDILANLGVGGTGKRNGGGIDFGPEGPVRILYVSTGDMEVPANGQSLSGLQAKVLRLKDDGSIPSNNPTPGSALYTRGLRDPRGLAVSFLGKVFTSDLGQGTIPVVQDEINLAPSNGNLGWSSVSGSDGPGGFDDPYKSWGPGGTGVHGVVDYAGVLFPQADSDAKDNDNDRYGTDRLPGVAHTDDNNLGECIGSGNNGDPCTSAILDCTPARAGENSPQCEKRDEIAEGCLGDDDCDSVGDRGIDEPDESYFLDVFAARGNSIERAVLMGANSDQLSTWQTFFTSSALPDCPSSFTGMMAGRDGHLYVLARTGGVGGGALYRIVYDQIARPREVSPLNGYVPLRLGKNGSDIEIYWEDLREDAMQVGDNGSVATAPVHSYTIWRGTLADLLDGNSTLLTQAAAASDVAGTGVNFVVRKSVVPTTPGQDQYFLVSGRGANLEGTPGSGDWKPPQGLEDYPGHTVTDLCTTIGLYAPPSTSNLFKCAPEITLFNQHGVLRKLSDYRGRAVWLDFPAEWCGPCISQANVMESVYQDYKDRGIVAISALMDEEEGPPTYPDWDGRPTQAECRLWGNRPGTAADHTFECWADPVHCNGNPCSTNITQEGWPKFNAFNGLPTNAIIDQGGRVVWTEAGWDVSVENKIRNRLNVLVGSSDSCLH